MSTTAGSWAKRTCVVMLAVGVLAPAAEAQTPGPAIEILSPQRGAVHIAATPDRALKVRVRVAAGVRNLRAVVSGRRERVVTKRFRRGRGGTRTATLRLGRELSRGPGAVRLSGRRGGARVAASAHFFVVSRRAELLRVRGLPRRSSARPLAVRLKTTERVDDVRVRVNGHGARDSFSRTAGGDWRARLSASGGLRFGRNRITVTAYDRDGAFERVSRIVHVRRGRPLVGAGADRLVRKGEPVRLDGRTTLPRRDERLRFTWRIVRRPSGSKARLRSPHAVRPLLLSDRPGVYRIRLTVSARRARGTASAAAAPGSDVVNVGVQPATSPKGIPVQTVGAEDGVAGGPGIKVGDQWHPMGSVEEGAVQMIVLEGGTLSMLSDTTYPGTDIGIGNLQTDISNVLDTSIVLLANPSTRPIDLSQIGQFRLARALANLGVDPDGSTGRWFAPGAPVAGWSVVSSTDGRPGSALIGLRKSPDRPVGEMDGFLQNSAGSGKDDPVGSTYVFSWPSTFNTFDTQSGGDNGTWNEMTIAGQTYRSDTIPSGASAFHLVWLDGGTLALRGQATISGDQGGQLAQTLAGISSGDSLIPLVQNPALLFMTTIGHPNIPRPSDGAANGWAKAAELIASFGGNASAFLSLGGSSNSEYSLVGASLSGEQAPNAGVDVSRVLQPSVPAPRLVGVLERRPGGAWSAATGGAPSGADDVAALMPDIKRVLAQPDQPFPAFTGPGERDAEQYIAKQVGLPYDATYGIRANYWNPKYDADWMGFRDDLIDTYNPPCPTTPCSDVFVKVITLLDREFRAVQRVRTYFGSYQDGTLYGALNHEYVSGAYSFDQISNDIMSKYHPPATQASGPSPFDIVEGMVDAAAELAPEGGEALGVAGAAIEIAGAFADTDQGSTNLGATVFEAQAATFASTLQQDFSNSLDGLNRIADLLVSDAGRLQEAGEKVVDDWAVDSGYVDATLDRGISAYMWGALLPTTFKAYQCVSPPVYYPPEASRAPWYDVDVNTPAGLQLRPFSTVTSFPSKNASGWGPTGDDGSQINDGFVTIGREDGGDYQYLDGPAAQDIFGGLDQNVPQQLGLLPAYFLAPQPATDAPGFEVDQGSFDPGPAQAQGYVTYSCADDEWHEDTNVGGQ